MKSIKKEILINAPASKVWEHITDPAKIATWFTPMDFAPKVGHHFTLNSKCGGGLSCVVQEVVPQRKLVYTFPIADFKIDTLVTFTLEQSGAATKLTLLHTGFDQLTAAQMAEVAPKYDGGWGTYLPQLQAQAAEPTLATAKA